MASVGSGSLRPFPSGLDRQPAPAGAAVVRRGCSRSGRRWKRYPPTPQMILTRRKMEATATLASLAINNKKRRWIWKSPAPRPVAIISIRPMINVGYCLLGPTIQMSHLHSSAQPFSDINPVASADGKESVRMARLDDSAECPTWLSGLGSDGPPALSLYSSLLIRFLFYYSYYTISLSLSCVYVCWFFSPIIGHVKVSRLSSLFRIWYHMCVCVCSIYQCSSPVYTYVF